MRRRSTRTRRGNPGGSESFNVKSAKLAAQALRDLPGRYVSDLHEHADGSVSFTVAWKDRDGHQSRKFRFEPSGRIVTTKSNPGKRNPMTLSVKGRRVRVHSLGKGIRFAQRAWPGEAAIVAHSLKQAKRIHRDYGEAWTNPHHSSRPSSPREGDTYIRFNGKQRRYELLAYDPRFGARPWIGAGGAAGAAGWRIAAEGSRDACEKAGAGLRGQLARSNPGHPRPTRAVVLKSKSTSDYTISRVTDHRGDKLFYVRFISGPHAGHSGNDYVLGDLLDWVRRMGYTVRGSRSNPGLSKRQGVRRERRKWRTLSKADRKRIHREETVEVRDIYRNPRRHPSTLTYQFDAINSEGLRSSPWLADRAAGRTWLQNLVKFLNSRGYGRPVKITDFEVITRRRKSYR